MCAWSAITTTIVFAASLASQYTRNRKQTCLCLRMIRQECESPHGTRRLWNYPLHSRRSLAFEERNHSRFRQFLERFFGKRMQTETIKCRVVLCNCSKKNIFRSSIVFKLNKGKTFVADFKSKTQGEGRGVSQRFREGASNQTLSSTGAGGALSKPVAHSASLTLDHF